MSDQTIPLSDKERADMLRLMYDEKVSELAAAKAEIKVYDRNIHEQQLDLESLRAEVEALRLALNVASGALLQCEPCMATECNQVQREWLDDARKLIDAALAKEKSF